MPETRSAADLRSVTYTKPASAEPRATFEVMFATFVSWLTVFELRIDERCNRRSSWRV
jgi:hypothetical protein